MPHGQLAGHGFIDPKGNNQYGQGGGQKLQIHGIQHIADQAGSNGVNRLLFVNLLSGHFLGHCWSRLSQRHDKAVVSGKVFANLPLI
ncbi:MAG: hypothetical protein ACLPYB_10925 [Desulfobaccales bacterium]